MKFAHRSHGENVLISLLIVLIVAMAAWGVQWVVASAIFSSSSVPTSKLVAASSPLSSDPACDGYNDPRAGLGYGVEHSYDGQLSPGQSVHIVLSCDLSRLTISGAVSQTISAATLAQDPSATSTILEGDHFDEGSNLADLSGGESAVRLNQDYSFDGYNDLVTVAKSGSGAVRYFVFIYDPVTRQFKFNSAISALPNLYLGANAASAREVSSSVDFGENGISVTKYKWAPDGSLYRSGEDDCLSNTEEAGTGKSAIKYYMRDMTIYTSDGKTASSSKSKLSIDEATRQCFSGGIRI